MFTTTIGTFISNLPFWQLGLFALVGVIGFPLFIMMLTSFVDSITGAAFE